LLASGQAPSRLVLAKLMAVHRHTIQTWLRLYEAGGLSAVLTIKKAPGKRPSLTPAILTKLRARLAHNRGFGSYGEIRQYLARVHKIHLAYSTVHKLVRYRLKAKPKAPRRSHPKKSLRTSRSSDLP
jgi:transposase